MSNPGSTTQQLPISRGALTAAIANGMSPVGERPPETPTTQMLAAAGFAFYGEIPVNTLAFARKNIVIFFQSERFLYAYKILARDGERGPAVASLGSAATFDLQKLEAQIQKWAEIANTTDGMKIIRHTICRGPVTVNHN